MYAPFYPNRRTRRVTAVCLLLLLTAALSCPAQNKKKLPDSIPGSLENTPDIVDTAITVSDSTRFTGTDHPADTGSGRPDTLTQQDSATLRTVPDSVITRLKKDRDFAYANDPAYWTHAKEKEGDNKFLRSLIRLLSSRGFQYFIYLLLAAVLLYALYRIIAENNLRLFYRAPAKSPAAPGQEVSLEEEDLDEGYKQALVTGDHRLATRYLYLKALRLLDTKNLIRYHPQATNQEYISQLSALPQGAAFRFLTGAYERVWYGDFAITEPQFERLLLYFQDFYTSLTPRPPKGGG